MSLGGNLSCWGRIRTNETVSRARERDRQRGGHERGSGKRVEKGREG